MRKRILLGATIWMISLMAGCQGSTGAEVPTVTNTPVPTATSTPVPTATSTPVPTATSTPVPTATSTPMPTATPKQILMVTYVENGDGTVTVDGLSSEVGEALNSGKIEILVIPAEINGMKVVKVQEWAFCYIPGLIEKIIFMGEDTNEIGADAFMSCGNYLERVELPKKLRCIASHAFSNCTRLQEIELPNTVQIIGPNAFRGCSSLEKLELPASVEKIGEYAFNGTAIKEFTLPAGTLCVHKCYREGDYYFSTQPDDGYSDGTVFRGMSELEKICVAEGNELYTSVDGILYNKDLTELIKIPQAYNKPVVLPDTVSKVNMAAYDGCEKLKEISFPASIEGDNYYRWLREECPNLKKDNSTKRVLCGNFCA